MSKVLQIKNLSKKYSGSKDFALSKLSLHINSGEVYGFLGSNGAGKSTTIRTLLGFLLPTSGTATILGMDIVRNSVLVKKHVGFLSGDVALYGKATGKEQLDYLAKLQPPKDATYRKVLEKRFEAQLGKPAKDLSKGNRQKIGILQAFMHQPQVIILDEPTSGLDPLMQEAFYQTILENKARGAAIFMSSHNLGEAERICDRIGVIKNGKLVHEQMLNGSAQLAAPRYHVIFASEASSKLAAGSPALQILEHAGNTLVFIPKGPVADALAVISKYKIVSLETEKPSLEDEFLSFYSDSKASEATHV
ncbi:MAG: ABC transporter ATP-binding protein [Candidatus Saccharimonadales bacterium]